MSFDEELYEYFKKYGNPAYPKKYFSDYQYMPFIPYMEPKMTVARLIEILSKLPQNQETNISQVDVTSTTVTSYTLHRTDGSPNTKITLK